MGGALTASVSDCWHKAFTGTLNMAQSATRIVLLGSASTALMLFLAPGVVAAQSTTCSQTGSGFTCVDGATTVLTGSASSGTTVVAGPGLTTVNGTTASTIVYNGAGPIWTTNVRGVSLTSTGGALTFGPATNSAPVNIRTTGGVGAHGLTVNSAGNAATVTVGNISTTGAASLGVLVTGGAGLTLRTGDITTTGSNSDGINISGVTTAAVICGNISTRSNSAGIVVAANGDTSVTCGTVSTISGGFGGDAIRVTNTSGTTTVNGGTTSAEGTDSGAGNVRGIFVSSSAPSASNLVTVNTGVVTATGNAVTANATGGADVLVNATGNVTSTTEAGIIATTAGGAATVNQALGTTITSFGDAIRVNNTGGGAINVNALGQLVARQGSGVYVSTSAASADPINVTTNIIRSTGSNNWGSQVRASAGTGDITITSNGAISGGADGIQALTTGTSNRNVTVFVNADIGTPTLGSSGPQVLVSGTSSTAKTLAVNISNASVFGGLGAVRVQQNATSLGQISIVGAGAGTLNSTSGIGVNALILNASNPGAILIDLTQNVNGRAQGINATTSGTGAVTVNARGNVSSLDGPAISVSTRGTALVTVGAASTISSFFSNEINSTAVGGTAITNPGVIQWNGGFSIDVNGGAGTIFNSGTLNGRIDLTDNADTFTNAAGGRFNAISTSDFGLGADTFSNSGVLTAFQSATFNGLETFNNAGLVDLRDGIAKVALTLTGTTFTGGAGSQLGVDVDFANNTSDRLVIGTAAGATTILLNNTAPDTAPLLNLTGLLVVDANAATASNFQLGGTSDFGFTRANLVFEAATSDFRVTIVPDTEVFETGRYGAGMANAWNQSGDAWSARMTELRDVAFSRLKERPDGFETWAQGYAGSEGQDQIRSFNPGGTPTTVDLSYDQAFQGFQVGGDVQRSLDWGSMVFGLTGGVINSDQTFNSGNAFELQAGNIGVYAGLYVGGFFLNGLVKADRYDGTVMSSTAFFRDDIEGTTIGAKGEAGYRMGLGGFFVEPVVALAYTDSDLDDLTVPGGVFTFEDNEGLRGEAGVSIGGDFAIGSSRIQPFIGLFAVDELRGQNTAVFNSGPTAFGLQDVEPRTYGKISVGLNLLEQDGVNLFVRGDSLFGGEAKGGSVRIGAHWSF